MGIPVSKEFVLKLIRDRWDGVDDLEQGWIERVSEGLQKIGTARDRASIYRWLSRGLPNDRNPVFGFAAVLGVDPLVLLDLENPKFQNLLKLEWFFFLANMESKGNLSAIWPLVRPAVHWPNSLISNDFYGSRWATAEFSHTAENICNVYAQLRITGELGDREDLTHRVYYFAYQRGGARDGLWRPYGIVRKRGREAICLGHNGDMREDSHGRPTRLRIEDGGAIDVETFLGPGPCEFKVACLHPFTLEVIAPSKAQTALRFSA